MIPILTRHLRVTPKRLSEPHFVSLYAWKEIWRYKLRSQKSHGRFINELEPIISQQVIVRLKFEARFTESGVACMLTFINRNTTVS